MSRVIAANTASCLLACARGRVVDFPLVTVLVLPRLCITSACVRIRIMYLLRVAPQLLILYGLIMAPYTASCSPTVHAVPAQAADWAYSSVHVPKASTPANVDALLSVVNIVPITDAASHIAAHTV